MTQEVRALDGVQEDPEEWADDPEWVETCRAVNAGKYPVCPTCGMLLGLAQTVEDCSNCT